VQIKFVVSLWTLYVADTGIIMHSVDFSGFLTVVVIFLWNVAHISFHKW